MERKADYKLKSYRNLEDLVQSKWSHEKAYETSKSESNSDKFFATFPYPYMNGRLHIGHAFSLSKAEVNIINSLFVQLIQYIFTHSLLVRFTLSAFNG